MSVEAVRVPRKYEVQGVRIVLDILQNLSAAPGGERLSPFLKKLQGVSKNRLFRTLSTLEAEAFVVKNSEGNYCLGPAAYGLAKEILVEQDGPARGRPMMQALAEATGEAVYLARLLNGEALLIDYEESVHKVRAMRCLGKTFAVTDGVLVADTDRYQVFVAENSLVDEVTTLSVVFSDCFDREPVALVLVAPSCRLSRERIVSEVLPALVEQSRGFVWAGCV